MRSDPPSGFSGGAAVRLTAAYVFLGDSSALTRAS